jgi:hypothetical protein
MLRTCGFDGKYGLSRGELQTFSQTVERVWTVGETERYVHLLRRRAARPVEIQTSNGSA